LVVFRMSVTKITFAKSLVGNKFCSTFDPYSL
jgi:hypothetical protein